MKDIDEITYIHDMILDLYGSEFFLLIDPRFSFSQFRDN